MRSAFLGLRTTIYKVRDIEKAKQWYSGVLGIKPYFDEPFYVGFNVGGYELGLQPEQETEDEKADTVISYWGVENIYQVYETLVLQGAAENEKPYNVGGELMTATVKDPWGNIIGIIYNPEFRIL